MILSIDNGLSIGFPISNFIDWSGRADIEPFQPQVSKRVFRINQIYQPSSQGVDTIWR